MKKSTVMFIVVFLLFNLFIINPNTQDWAGLSIASDGDGNSERSEARSNGIFTWSSIEVISEPVPGVNININYSTRPVVAIENDKVYVVWHDNSSINGAGGDFDIFYRYYDGNVWSEIQVISEPVQGQNMNILDSYGPDIAVENGNIYVVWHDFNNTTSAGDSDADIFYRCNLTGSSWEDIQVISEPIQGQDTNIGESRAPVIAVENDQIYVTWHDTNNTNVAGGDSDIFYRHYNNNVWSEIQVISEPVQGHDLNIEESARSDIAVENGKIYIVWDDKNNTNSAGTDSDIFYRCNTTGTSWEPIQVISEPVFGMGLNSKQSISSKIEVENDNIYVIWQDNSDLFGSGQDADLFYRCNLTGSGWEDIQVISEPVPGQNFNIGGGLPRSDIAIKNCKIYIVWCDSNDTNGAETDRDISFRYNLTGSTWEDTQVISEPVIGKNFNTGDSWAPDIAVGNDKIHIVWVDGNNTNGAGNDDDIFYRWKNAPDFPLFFNSPKVTPNIGNTSTEFNFTIKYYHLNDSAPTEVKVFIDSTEYSMLEVDPGDTNYMDGKDYFLKIKYLDIGTHTCKFWASNGTKTTSTGLFNLPKVLNTPPKIITQDNLTAIEDTYYEVSYEFEDLDVDNVGQSCFWEFYTNANWLSFISNPPTLGGTPTNDDVGKYWVNIIIDDTIDIDERNFTLTVVEVNDNPEIITINVEQINEDDFYEVDYSASDIDSPIENQIWSLDTNTSLWLNLNINSGVLNGTPTNYDVGIYWVNVSVDDNEGGADFTNFTLTVVNVNDPPFIITDDLTFIRLGDFYEVDYVAGDIDNPASDLIWSCETNASWLSLNSSTGVLNGTPTYDDIGLYVVNVSVDDGDGGSDWHEFELSVLNRISNFPPEIETSDLTEIMVNEFYRVDYNATDDHTPSDQLIWNLETNASWLNIDLMTGVLSGTPTEADAGWYWVKITVWDGEDGWNVHNFTVMVKKEPSIRNNAPILSKPKMSPEAGDTKTEFIFSVDYYDAEGEPPVLIQLVMDIGTYDLELRSGETANGTYQYTINLPEGQHKYYFTASDGLNKVNTDRFFTNNIQKEKQVSKGENSVGFIVAIIIIIIIVLIFLFFIIFRKKKKQKEEAKIELAPAIPTPVLDISSYPTTTYPSQQIDQPPTDIPLLITQPAPTETASQEPASEPVVHIEESQSMVNVENGLMLKVGKEGELKPVQKDVDEESKNNKNEI